MTLAGEINRVTSNVNEKRQQAIPQLRAMTRRGEATLAGTFGGFVRVPALPRPSDPFFIVGEADDASSGREDNF